MSARKQIMSRSGSELLQMKPTKFDLEGFVGLKDALKQINKIDGSKLSLLLMKIVEKYQDEVVFVEEEKIKLISELHLADGNELLSLGKLCHLMMQQAVYHLLSTSMLRNELLVLGLSENNVSAFCEVWSSNRKDLMLKARETSLSSNRLASVDWSLSLILGTDSSSSLSSASHVKPRTVLDLRLTDPEMKDNIVSLEFDHKGLYEFYRQLEAIQQQLDILTSWA